MAKSRLHRQFGIPDGESLFVFSSLGDKYYDSDIVGVTITRGSASHLPTFTPSTMEIEVTGARHFRTTAFAEFKANYSHIYPFMGATPSLDNHAKRFWGTKTLSTVDDRRWARSGVTPIWTTTATCVSMTARVRSYGLQFNAREGYATVSYVRTHLNQGVQKDFVENSSVKTFDTIAGPDEKLDFEEAIRKYADELGTHIQHQRDGRVRIESIQSRADKLVSASKSDYSIQRDQCLSPARWSSNAEMPTTQLVVKRRLSTGQVTEQDWPTGTIYDVMRREVVDLTHVMPTTDSYKNIMSAKNMLTNWSKLAVDEITIDLGLLFTRRRPIDRLIFKQLLGHEVGDPIFLDNDWPQGVQGAYFSTQIKESISPDGWLITIGLAPAHYVIGVYPDNLPTFTPKTWDQVNSPWDSPP